MSATTQAKISKGQAPTLSGFLFEVDGTNLNFRVAARHSSFPTDRTIRTKDGDMGMLGPLVEARFGSDRCRVPKGLSPEKALELYHNPGVLVPLSVGEFLLSSEEISTTLSPFQPFFCGTVVGWGPVSGGTIEFQNPVDGWTRIIDGIKFEGLSGGKLFAINPVAITKKGELELRGGKPVFLYDVEIDWKMKRTVFTPKDEKSAIVRNTIDSGESPYDVADKRSGLPAKDYDGLSNQTPVRFYFDSESFVGLPVIMSLNGNGSTVMLDARMLGRQFAVLTLEPNPREGRSGNNHGKNGH